MVQGRVGLDPAYLQEVGELAEEARRRVDERD